MELIWIFYWLLLLVIFLLGFIYLFKSKKRKWLGLLQSLLTLFWAVWAFIFALQRDFSKESELDYLLFELSNGSIEAILLILTFLILIIICICNIIFLTKKERICHD